MTFWLLLLLLGVVSFVAIFRDAVNAKREPMPGSMEDPRVAYMVTRQRAFGKRLRREGKSLLAGKHYIPELTKASEAPKSMPKIRRVK